MTEERIIEDDRVFGAEGKYKIVERSGGTKEVVDMSYYGGKTIGTIASYFGGGSDFVSNDGSRTPIDERALDGRLSNYEAVHEIRRVHGSGQSSSPGPAPDAFYRGSTTDYDLGSYRGLSAWDRPETFWGWVWYIILMAITTVFVVIGVAYVIFFPLGLMLTVALAGAIFAAVMYCYEFLVWFLGAYGELLFRASVAGLVLWFAIWVWTPSMPKKPGNNRVKAKKK